MASSATAKGAQPLARLIGRVLDPVSARRGFATADLMAAWDDIVGPRYAPFTQPDKLAWPKGREGGGVLTVRVDGARAVFLQHESEQFIQRINRFLGFGAVAELRILQRPIRGRRREPASSKPAPLPTAEAEILRETVEAVSGDGLRDALLRLGEGVVRARLARL